MGIGGGYQSGESERELPRELTDAIRWTGGQYRDLMRSQPGTPEYFPGQNYTSASQDTQAMRDALRARSEGTLTEQGANQYVQDILGQSTAGTQALTDLAQGGLNQDLFNQAFGNLTEQFNEEVLPNINAQFASAGRTGSDTQAQVLTGAAGELADAGQQLAAQMTENALNRQLAAGQALQGAGLSATGLVPSLSGLDYQNIDALARAGQNVEDFDRERTQAAMDRYNWNAGRDIQDWERRAGALGNYVGLHSPLAAGGKTSTEGGSFGKS